MARSVVVCAVLAVILVKATSTIASTADTGNGSNTCRPLVVAHRGASGYIPEHTLAAYSLAVFMGADFVEPDLVMTKDGHLIARHENELSSTTDVASHVEYAHYYRSKTVDQRTKTGWFSEDLTLEEVKTLRVKELFPAVRPGNARIDGSLEIPTLQEIINLVKGLEVNEGRIIGIYPEIKHGNHFKRLGLAMERPLVEVLHENGYRTSDSPIYIQSFEVSNLKELKNLTDLHLVQLYGARARRPADQAALGTGLTYGDMATPGGLRDVAKYATGVGPEKSYIIPRDRFNRLGQVTSFVADAHAAGLLVHPYTFRAENPYLPAEFRSDNPSLAAIGNARGEIEAFFAAGVDGVFADQPDIPVRVRGCRSAIPHYNGAWRNLVAWQWILILTYIMYKLYI